MPPVTKNHHVIAFGELLWDLLPEKSIIGGAPFNFANRVNELGGKAYIISKVGTDHLGEKALQTVHNMKMDDGFIQRDEKKATGTVEVYFDTYKNPDYTIIPNVAYDFIEFNDNVDRLCKQASCICFGTLAQRNHVSQKTLERILDRFKGPWLLYDINLRKDCYNAEIISNSLKRANILKLNEEELEILSGMNNVLPDDPKRACLKLIEKYSLKYCLVTLESMGILGVSDRGEIVYEPGYEIKLVDPLGAGDAFSAGFIFSILQGKTFRQACAYGNILGAIVVSQPGATQLINPEQIEQFKAKKLKRKSYPNLNPQL